MKKKLKRSPFHIWVIGLSFISLEIRAQDGYPFDQVPVDFGINALQTSENLSSGVLNISLPIENHIIPVSLNYTTSGIRVSQRASIVGLGWNLAAGGEITRQVRGLPDDFEQGYSGYHQRGKELNESGLPDGTLAIKKMLNSGQSTDWDSEPDIYSFSFMGQGGMFTLDADRKVIKLTPNNYKISVQYIDTSPGGYFEFTIVDDQGNIYLFDQREEIKTTKDGNARSFDRKWHLTKITDYQTGLETTLSYVTFEEHTETNTFRSKATSIDDYTHVLGSVTDEIDISLTPYLLHTILFNETKIDFDYESQNDPNSTLKSLKNIIYYVNEQEVKKYTFDYKYLGNTSRMMLAGVIKSTLNVAMYQFTYYGEASSEKKLPDYNSFKQDHWGFYNNNTASSPYPVDGANKEPSLPYAKANSLKRIYNTSGGYQEMEYELNTYFDGATTHSAGGLRIAKVYKGKDNGDRFQSKSYSYDHDGVSSGHLYAIPQYDYNYINEGAVSGQYTVHRSQSIENLSDPMGRHIAYEYVKVTDPDNGYTQTRFHVFEDDKNEFGTNTWEKGTLINEATPILSAASSTSQGPFGSSNFNGSATGLPKEVEIRRHDGILLSTEQLQYDYDPNVVNKNTFGFHVLKIGAIFYEDEAPDSDQYLSISKYQTNVYTNNPGQVLLKKKISTTFDPDDASKSLSSISDYIYQTGEYTLLDTHTVYLQGDEANTQSTRTDFLVSKASNIHSDEARADNIVRAVDKSFTYVNGETISETQSTYEVSSGKLRLQNQKSYLFESGTPDLVGDITYGYGTGRVVEVMNNTTGKASTQIWNQNESVVVASINNAEVSNCAYSGFEDYSPGGWEFTLVITPRCGGLSKAQCESNCVPNNDVDIHDYDFDELEACQNRCKSCDIPVNVTTGFIGDYAYQLTNGSVSKELAAGKTYQLSYWKRAGTVSISGLSANELRATKTIGDWVFEKRIITKNTESGAITISGTAVIDELKIYPKEAKMSSLTFDPAIGKTSETDANDQMIFYEYDQAGRITSVKDNNLDILSTKTYQIAKFIETSDSSLGLNYQEGTVDFFVVSNGTWKITDTEDWFSVSPTSGERNQKVSLTYLTNYTSAFRSGNLKVSAIDASTVDDVFIAVQQDFSTESLMSVSPTVVGSSGGTIQVNSNTSWSASVSTQPSGGNLSLSNFTGTSGDGSFRINYTDYGIDEGGVDYGAVMVSSDDGQHKVTVVVSL